MSLNEQNFEDYVEEIDEGTYSDSEIQNQKEMYQVYLEHQKKMYPARLLWKKTRKYVLSKMGEKEFNKLPIEQKRKLILQVLFSCKQINNVLLQKYSDIISFLNKDKHKWVKSLKQLVEDGGKAILVGRTSNKYNKEDILKFTYTSGVKNIKPLSNKELENLANHLNDRFIIIYENGKPKDIKIVDRKKEEQNLEKLLNNLNIDDDQDIENMINKLKKMDLKETKTKLDNSQIRGLINLLSDKSEFNNKYNTLKKLRYINKPDHKKIDSGVNAFPLGTYDPDFNNKLYGVNVEYWNPFLTPQTKKQRFVRTEEIFKITRKGEKIYIFPQIINIKGDDYYYIRRFFDFDDFLKQYQINFIRRFKKEKHPVYLDKISKIHNYFVDKKEKTEKIKMYIKDNEVYEILNK